MGKVRSPLADPITGYVLLAAFCCFFLIDGRALSFGSLDQIGPGFFPTVLAALLLAMALGGMAVEVLRRRRIVRPAVPSGSIAEDEIWAIQWKPLVYVAAAIALFALTVRSLGLVPAAMGCTFVAGLASGATPKPRLAILALAVGAFVYTVFILALELSISAFRWPL